MHIRGPKPQWQSRRNMSLGPPVRRAHPASGATWNVQVVRGKMTSRCLWHACRALILGMVLMFLGAGMATIGYYAEDLSVGQEIRGNATVRVKNESRGFHLNNLSYVGPIVMGFGGFIVVAACVMTFEARDSAAKVVPARFKLSTTIRTPRTNSSSRRTTGSAISTSQAGSQTNRWENHLGVFRTSPATADGSGTVTDRKALTAALVHFSRALGIPRNATPPKSPTERRVSRCGSVPNMATITAGQRTNAAAGMVSQATMTTPPQTSHHKPSRHRCSRNSSMVQRSTMADRTSPLFLHPTSRLQWHRQALSVDETGFSVCGRTRGEGDGGHSEMGSNSSRIRDRTKRSDTARRHVLARQKPIEKEEVHHSPRGSYSRSSTTADVPNVFRKSYSRGSTVAVSRTPSIDSRAVQTDFPGSPELKRLLHNPKSPKRPIYTQWSTPSDERECKSQLSTTSEPDPIRRTLTGQSSFEPCLAEELPQPDDATPKNPIAHTTSTKSDPTAVSPSHPSHCPKRPDSLILNCSVAQPSSSVNEIVHSSPQGKRISSEKQKFLYRSNSSRLYKRPKPKVKLENEFDKIYFISSNKDDEFYDSIDVIDERRSSNFKRAGASGFCRSSTVIYSEYCSGSVLESTAVTPETTATSLGVLGKTAKTAATAKSSECVVADREDSGATGRRFVGRRFQNNNQKETANRSSVNDIEVEVEVEVCAASVVSDEVPEVPTGVGRLGAIGDANNAMGAHRKAHSIVSGEGVADAELADEEEEEEEGQITTITVRADIEDCSTHSQSTG